MSGIGEGSDRCKAEVKGMDGGGDESDDEPGEYGVRKTDKKADPKLPSEEERKEHEKTHLPYRSWCRHCVRGRGKEEPCRRQEGGGGEIPEFHVDFMFMGEEGGGKTIAILVGRQRVTKAVMATVVPRKSSGSWAARRLMAWLREVGHAQGDIIVKSDNEPALVALVEAWARLRAAEGGGRMVIEHSPVHSSQSNGVVERGIQAVQGMVRTLRSAIEDRWGVKLEADHVVWAWLVEYAGWLLTRCEVGRDGKTAYERIKGKRAKLHGMEFGEGVLWKRRREGGPLGKLTCMWDDGVYLGVKGSTGEIIVGDQKGVWVTRTVKRKPEEERWQRSNMKMIVGVPWKKNDEDEKADGEAMKAEVTIMDKEYRERMEEGRQSYEPVPRRVYLQKSDFERYGFSMGCPGCVSILKGTARQAHSEGCRKRMETEMKGLEKTREADRRREEYVEKAIARDVELRESKKRKSQTENAEQENVEKGSGVKMDVKNDADESAGSGRRKEGEKRKAEREDVEESERGEKRRAEEQEIVENTVKFLKKLDRKDRKRKSEGDLPEVLPGPKAEVEEGPMDNVEKVSGPKINGYDVDDELIEIADVDDKEHGDMAEGEDEQLDPELVRKGREEEVRFMVEKLQMFEFGTLEEAMRRNGGKTPTTTKWLGNWKMGDDGERFVRCRLVGRDFKTKGGKGEAAELFAAMPPLEAKKVLFRMAAAVRGRRRRSRQPEVKIMFVDVKKAHLNAPCDEEEWVELPEEFERWGKYARLRRWLYGMRRAAAGWEDEYAQKLEEAGFIRGVAAPTVFYNPKTKVRVVVHGDDFTFTGEKAELTKMAERMAAWWDVKMRGIMGSAPDEVKAMTILGRTVRWTEEGIEYEADDKHRKELLKAEGLTEESNGVVSAAVRPKVGEEELHGTELEGVERRRFREKAARLNYLGQDRSDIQYATKEVCTGMAKPTERGMMKIKRIARYLVEAEKIVWRMGEMRNDEELIIEVWVDSDWAKGCDRKSTSGGVMTVGGVAVKHWSRTQRTRALSVGEAEYAAMVSGCAEGLGLQALMKDLGWEAKVVVKTDSTTAKAVASRRGLGKLRHVEVRLLWVQDAVKKGRLTLKKVDGEKNVADHLTKEKALWEFEDLLRQVGGWVKRKEQVR